jgi:hypothetical protein
MKFTFNLTNKNILKKILAISLPVCVVGASITTYIVKTNNKENSNLVNNEVNIKNGVKRQVYLVTEDNLLTPITIVIENKELLTDEIASLVNLLKEDSEINHAHFKGVLPNNCDLKNVTIDDKTMTKITAKLIPIADDFFLETPKKGHIPMKRYKTTFSVKNAVNANIANSILCSLSFFNFLSINKNTL